MQRIKPRQFKRHPQLKPTQTDISKLKRPLLYHHLSTLITGAWHRLEHSRYASSHVEKQPYHGKFYNGVFHNQHNAPRPIVNGCTLSILFKFLFEKDPDERPTAPLPSMKTDLLNLSANDNIIVWMGHSSYFIQMDGVRFLLDPVFSHNASPLPHTNVVFKGSNPYNATDIPEIDYLLISHDHWDHLDYSTIHHLSPKIHHIVAPIGVGSYFRKWGFANSQIFEGDWFDTLTTPNVDIHILPAHHFSGRLLKRNPTLWGSFALISHQHKLYFSGDSGYNGHFKLIADRLGPFDIAIIENGQYNEHWADIHMMPEETAQAALDLQTRALIPAHNSKFKLAHHAWYAPLNQLTAASLDHPYQLMTPMIGEAVMIDNHQQTFTQWWKSRNTI